MSADRPKIVLCFPASDSQVQHIAAAAGPWDVIVSNQEQVGTDILGAEIFCGHAKHRQVDWGEVVRAGNLKWIQSTAAGLDHCLAPEVIRSEIVVSGCSGMFANQVAEQAMSLLFGLIRNLPDFFRAQQKKSYVRLPTDNLHGKAVGILGFGGIGQRIAQILGDIPRWIMATDKFHDAVASSHVDVLPAEKSLDLCRASDVVISTLPLTADTHQLLGREHFQAMPSGGYLINVGRGSVVNHSDLVQALRDEHLAGAGLDVADPEPLPADHPLWEMDNVIITPHVGAQSPLRVPLTVGLICENLRRYQQGLRLVNQVDKALGFPRPGDRISRQEMEALLVQ